jgi:hypothetical protein
VAKHPRLDAMQREAAVQLYPELRTVYFWLRPSLKPGRC